MKPIAGLLALVCLAGAAQATTWADAKLTDPLTGEKVPAKEIMSYGGYIYGWPSKFDLVFWPLTDESFICINEKTGYGAFNPDFEKLPEAELENLKKWLAANWNPKAPPRTHLEKLLWLEKVYAQRKMDENFWSRFFRLMAYVTRDDKEKSLAYVKKAMPLLEAKLAAGPKDAELLETLYLIGEYSRRLGDEARAREFFARVKTAKYTDRDGTEKTGHPYFTEIIADREKLLVSPKPGTK